MSEQFPKTIYVKWTDSGDGDHFLEATKDPIVFAEAGEHTKVGIYTFSDHGEVIADVEIKRRKGSIRQ